MKNIIINADDFGYSKENNEAVKLGYKAGIITSASIMTNMNGFRHAVDEILPDIPNLNPGFHFNVIEGECLSGGSLLCNSNKYFNNNFIQLMIKSQNKKFLKQLEQEFRIQLEKILKYYPVSHIDSHVHVHSIPAVFDLIINLCEEYNIKFIRTQKEIPYIVLKESLNGKYPVNILKNILLNNFTEINMNKLKQSKTQTNDYIIGVLYTGIMSRQTILKGLNKTAAENSITEVIFHPYYSENVEKEKNNSYKEFLITQIPNFKQELENSGFRLTNYGNITPPK